jgi:hypothetical protein
MNKNKIYYQFRIVQGNQTLVLEKPAQVTFQLIGGTGIFYGQCQINNTYNLETKEASLSAYKLPWEITLNNNEKEIDVNNYIIRFSGYLGNQLRVIIKYYQN